MMEDEGVGGALFDPQVNFQSFHELPTVLKEQKLNSVQLTEYSF